MCLFWGIPSLRYSFDCSEGLWPFTFADLFSMCLKKFYRCCLIWPLHVRILGRIWMVLIYKPSESVALWLLFCFQHCFRSFYLTILVDTNTATFNITVGIWIIALGISFDVYHISFDSIIQQDLTYWFLYKFKPCADMTYFLPNGGISPFFSSSCSFQKCIILFFSFANSCNFQYSNFYYWISFV